MLMHFRHKWLGWREAKPIRWRQFRSLRFRPFSMKYHILFYIFGILMNWIFYLCKKIQKSLYHDVIIKWSELPPPDRFCLPSTYKILLIFFLDWFNDYFTGCLNMYYTYIIFYTKTWTKHMFHFNFGFRLQSRLAGETKSNLDMNSRFHFDFSTELSMTLS